MEVKSATDSSEVRVRKIIKQLQVVSRCAFAWRGRFLRVFPDPPQMWKFATIVQMFALKTAKVFAMHTKRAVVLTQVTLARWFPWVWQKLSKILQVFNK